MIKILVTGSNGFIGKHLCSRFSYIPNTVIYRFDREDAICNLDKYLLDCDIIYHFGGINRSTNPNDFVESNTNFTEYIVNRLMEYGKSTTIIFSSSIHAHKDTVYGVTKGNSEDILLNYNRTTTAKVFIYRFPNVFGKWAKPNYNSVVATFCHNIANELPIMVNDPELTLDLVYIDDLIDEMAEVLLGKMQYTGILSPKLTYKISLGELAKLLYDFSEHQNKNTLPNLSDEFTKKLFSTYISYYDPNKLRYALLKHSDDRGSFTEVFKSQNIGQFSINTIMPNQTKGNHWHNLKMEKFVVFSGNAIIRLRHINSQSISTFIVNGQKPEIITIPIGYTHNISNIGETPVIFLIWANEIYNPEKPDTFFLEV